MAAVIAAAGLAVNFETLALPYTVPASVHSYKPDFLLPNGIVIETKGLFTLEDRKKMLLIKKQHPNVDIRMVFQNAKAKISKGSPTTYAMWAEKNGYLYAHKTIPHSWLTEPVDPAKLQALAQFYKT